LRLLLVLFLFEFLDDFEYSLFTILLELVQVAGLILLIRDFEWRNRQILIHQNVIQAEEVHLGRHELVLKHILDQLSLAKVLQFAVN
jgi:hypothetical protein